MAKFTRIVNGVLRSFDESGTPTVYLQPIDIVSSGAGANQLNGPVTAGTNVTLPSSGTYSGDELIVTLNGSYLDPVFDYNYVGSGTRTQVSFTFDLVVGDRIDFKKYRN
jgi:hypothetical protein